MIIKGETYLCYKEIEMRTNNNNIKKQVKKKENHKKIT